MSVTYNEPVPEVATRLTFQCNLAKRVAIDVGAALAAAFCVSPIITIVDRSIIMNASGAQKLGSALVGGVKQLTFTPTSFIRGLDFRLIWGLYTATYVVANVVDTVSELNKKDSAMPKFVVTTAVNGSLCIAKDRAFTRMFGTIAPTSLPIGSYGLFAVRDMATIGASFSLPVKVADHMHDEYGYDRKRALFAAQLLCPMAVQLVSTPMHLLGLDLYNNKTATTSQRASFVGREYLKSTAARISRIAPAFGIGGISNRHFRESTIRKLQ
ncbi:hypothetical protein SARC_10996 [Sphaeroforma arctica JP610]|uniref:Sequence orphan n=1 Tax=Sphaeroforma arctica JP610 TaxID=667725 RepID=A0A0L0FIC5_9EUKA|nr:hypothetical protein SARC_10996 [Sphaeroforma arctica JP610]KNC76505.1 hypothetical protein SARC_10996 [Sphaeroforma arctica JP610]|eukprot:XP_014150407.1 hypothetical protein SARC_10996 [Sphaeroforma arctica JP610]